MKSRLLLLFSFIVMAFQAEAQEGIPVYFDYLSDNYYLVHPAMAGISQGGKIRATARKQWFDVEDAPNLQTLNAHFRIGESKSGVGGIIFNDANGYHSQTGVKLTYAYHLNMGGEDVRMLNQLSFGLSATMLQSRLDQSEFRYNGVDNAINNGGDIKAAYFNADVGVSYNFKEFYGHLTILNLIPTDRNLYSRNRAGDPSETLIDNLRRYLISAGYVFGRNEVQVEPSLLFQMTDFTKEKTIDANAKVYKDVSFGRIWGGLSYRRSFDGTFISNGTEVRQQTLQLLTPIVGVNFKNFMVSYNYSYQFGDIRFDNGGFHQITLGYDFGQTERRYDCYCPAAN